MRAARKYQEDLRRAIAERWPDVGVEFSQRKKHNQVTLTHRGRSRFVVFPVSPSDGARGFKRTMNDVRGELRNLGIAT